MPLLIQGETRGVTLKKYLGVSLSQRMHIKAIALVATTAAVIGTAGGNVWSCPGYAPLRIAGAMESRGLCAHDRGRARKLGAR